jgi:hypothetical protein
MIRWLSPLLLVATATAAAPDLARVKAVAQQLRRERVEITKPNTLTRGATPLLTTLKHELRDAIEAELGRHSPATMVASEFAQSFNTALRSEGLVVPFEDWTNLAGDLDEIQVTVPSKPNFVLVVTGAAIFCGYDHSV